MEKEHYTKSKLQNMILPNWGLYTIGELLFELLGYLSRYYTTKDFYPK